MQRKKKIEKKIEIDIFIEILFEKSSVSNPDLVVRLYSDIYFKIDLEIPKSKFARIFGTSKAKMNNPKY
jgi:hypothetical protein